MLQLVKTTRQANFKYFKRFGAFKELFEQNKKKQKRRGPTHAKKSPIYT
jgi:hypothetical protein